MDSWRSKLDLCCKAVHKVLEHLIHARIAPFINRQLSESQGGFRWGADVLVGSLVNLLSMRASTHMFVAFVDIEKAFDTSWVEAMLVRLHDIGVRGLVWNLLSNFLRHTVSQVRLGNELSDQWVDSGIAQERVLLENGDNDAVLPQRWDSTPRQDKVEQLHQRTLPPRKHHLEKGVGESIKANRGLNASRQGTSKL